MEFFASVNTNSEATDKSKDGSVKLKYFGNTPNTSIMFAIMMEFYTL